jgi:hypothetical protein
MIALLRPLEATAEPNPAISEAGDVLIGKVELFGENTETAAALLTAAVPWPQAKLRTTVARTLADNLMTFFII